MPVTNTPNASIEYEVHGSGPSLVLVNGLGLGRGGSAWGTSPATWRISSATWA